MLAWLKNRKPKCPGSKLALPVYFYLFPPILYLSSLSPCDCPFASSPCLPLGQVRGSREEMTGNKTMEWVVCQFPGVAGSLLPPPTALQGVSSGYRPVATIHTRVCSFLLYTHSNGDNAESKKLGLILCVSLKQAP